ncbi:hypothetical protein HZS_3847, partial [Henneguya salminicola]
DSKDEHNDPQNVIPLKTSPKHFPPFSVTKKELSSIGAEYSKNLSGARAHSCIIQDYYTSKNCTKIHLLNQINQLTHEAIIFDCPYKFYKNDTVVIKGSCTNGIFDLNIGSGNYIILHPSHFVSITSVASATKCVRQAVLAERLSGLTLPTIPMILGSLGHYIIEYLITKNDYGVDITFPKKSLKEELKEKVRIFLHSDNTTQLLYTGNTTIETILERFEEYYSPIIEWAQKILCQEFDMNRSFIVDNCMVKFKIIGVEEFIEDRVYGL